MQVDHYFFTSTILILVLLSILGLTMRALYLEGSSIGSVEFRASPEENSGVTESIEPGRYPILSVLDLTRTPP